MSEVKRKLLFGDCLELMKLIPTGSVNLVVTDPPYNIEEIKNKLDPNRNMYFLYSISDNPNWDYQEKLMEIGERYHLG